jgi:hypothetical protein
MIVNDDSSIVNKLETSLIDDATVIIDDHHIFMVRASVFTKFHIYALKKVLTIVISKFHKKILRFSEKSFTIMFCKYQCFKTL